MEGLRNTSAIVVGERGTGKTALSLDVSKELASEEALLVRIEEFSALGRDFAAEDLYHFLTQRIAAEYFLKAADHPGWLWRLNKDERVDLSLFLHRFLGASSTRQLREKIYKIQNKPLKRWAINTYNFTRVVLNYGLKAATKVASDALTKHFSSLPTIDSGDTEYFQRIEAEVDDSFTVEQRKYYYLERICTLALKSGISKIYVTIDKLDEDPRFENDAEDIGEFLVKIASDNKILTAGFFHLLLFSWSTPFNLIKSNVRTQKITFQTLDWEIDDLRRVAGKRLASYSERKLTSIKDIFQDGCDAEIEQVLQMCNRNPRDLWHILDQCLKAQYKIDSKQKIGAEAIRGGIEAFVQGFNYYEYYPRKSNARRNSMDVYAYIKHLLKLDGERFTKDKLNTLAGTGSSTSNYVVAMENMGLIRRISEKAQGGAVVYEIRDPKVCYAMRHGMTIGD
ncbi:MAG: hypothetical protein AB1941_26375 [Gemmatimonadota bacterium]